ncbi:MAG: hypothetical protein PVF51_09565 [Nitrospirota bacterium]
MAPRRTLSGFYIASLPGGEGETHYRCQVVPGVVWHKRRLSILLGASLDPRATEVRVVVDHDNGKRARSFEIAVEGGLHTRLEMNARLRRLPPGLTMNMSFVQWKPSGNLVMLPEYARGIVIGRPHVTYLPPTTAEDFPFGTPCVALGWRSARVGLLNGEFATGGFQVGVQGIRRVPDMSPLCGSR